MPITRPVHFNNLSFAQSNQNLLVTNDLATGNILFTSVNHNIPPKVLGTLDAVVDPRSSQAIPRIRVRQLAEDGTVERVLIRRKPVWRFFSEQPGSEGPARITTATNSLTAELEVVTYLNSIFSEIPATTSTILNFTASDSLDCRRDATNTTVLFDNGKEHAVNAILAQVNGIGLINVTDHATQQIHFRNIRPDKVTIAGLAISSDALTVVNALNALFAVQPSGGVVLPSTIYPTLGGQLVSLNRAEHGTGNGIASTKDVTAGDHNARAWSPEFINAKGEYFDFEMTGTGNFIAGFYDALTQSDAIADNDLTEKFDGLYWGVEVCDFGGYHAPHAVMGSNPTLAYGAGWQSSDNLTLYRTNGIVQDAHTNDGAVLWRAGIDQNGYGYVSYLDEGRSNQYILIARTGQTVDNLNVNLGLVVKLLTNEAALKEVPSVIGSDVDVPLLQYRYIESPDGAFYYPLFQTQEEANHLDTVNGGVGESHSHIFVDEPTGTVWYMPNTGGVHAGSAAPTESFYTPIPTEADSFYVPAAVTPVDRTFTEGESVNFRLIPDGDTANPVINNLPAGLTYSNNFVTGTAPYVAEDRTYEVVVTRTNAFGTRAESFNISITDNASLSVFPGYTVEYGNTVNVGSSPVFAVADTPDYIGGLLTFDQAINPGERFSYAQPFSGAGSSIGILNALGLSRLAAADNDNPADLRSTTAWELRWISFGGYIGGGSGVEYALGGWSNNSSVARNTSGNQGSTFELEYGADGYFRLYQTGYNGDPTKVLHKTSQNTFTGPQTIRVYQHQNSQAHNSWIPAATITSLTGSATTPPAGFVSPLTAGQLDGSLLLDNDSVATFSQKLVAGKRWVIPTAYVEQNWLPYMDLGKIYLGVPKGVADWGDVSINDFKAVIRIHQPDAAVSSHRSQITADGTSDTNTVNSLAAAYWSYALEWDGTDLHVIAHSSLSDLLLSPGIANGGTFDRVKTVTPATGGDQDVVVAVDEFAAQANLTTSGLHIIDTPTSAPATLTSWTKALHFGGSPEFARNANMGYNNNPMMTGGRSGLVVLGDYPDASYYETHYSNGSNSRPFLLSAVFNPEVQTENAGIFGTSEGDHDGADNWMLRIDENGMVNYTVGSIEDGVNRADLFTATAGEWYGVYVDYSGARLATPSATELNYVFRFFQVNLATGEATRISPNWTSTGGQFTHNNSSGQVFVGKIGSSAGATGHFKGKIAATVESTLPSSTYGAPGDADYMDQTKLSDTEIGMIVQDPIRWLQDYKAGMPYRRPQNPVLTANFLLDGFWESLATKVWLMGDGQFDSYAQIRNAVRPSQTSYVSMLTQNMVSSDIESVTIPGLTS